MELTCSVDFRNGIVVVGGDGSAGAAVDSIRATVAAAAPSRPVTQRPAAGCASAGSGQRQGVLRHLHTAAVTAPAGHAAALASIRSAGGTVREDGVSALPDEALHPTQLDAALHLAAVDASAGRRGLRVPAAAGCFFLQRPAARQGRALQQMVSTAHAASVANSGHHHQEAWSTSEHQLDVGSACCVLSGMLAKPLKADLFTAGRPSTKPDQHAADMLYGVEWQATAALGPCSSAAEHPPDTPAISANASPVALRMRASQGPAQMAAAGAQLAAVNDVAPPQGVAALTAALELGARPAHHHSATAAVQSGILAGIMKTIAREETSTRVSTQMLDRQDAVVSRAAGPRLQLNVSFADHKQSADEHGVALSGGAEFTPAMTRSPLSTAVHAARPDHLSHGTVIITGASLAPAAWSCSHLHYPTPTMTFRSATAFCMSLRLVNAA